MDICKLWDVYL